MISSITADRAARGLYKTARHQGIPLRRLEDARQCGGVQVAPLSYAQQRLWFLYQMNPESAAYNSSMSVRLRGPFHLSAMQRAFSAVAMRQGALRTRFEMRDGAPVQLVEQFLEPEETYVHLADAKDAEDLARQILVRHRDTPFDLARAPLIRYCILALGPEHHVLSVTMHHIITDEWSMQVLTREIVAAYSALVEHRELPFQALSVQYADYAEWQRSQLTEETLDHHLSYWEKKLAGDLAVTELRPDRNRPPVQSHRGGVRTRLLDPGVFQALRAVSFENKATVFMTLLASFQVLMFRHTGAKNLVEGTMSACRNVPEIEDLVGFFANTLALRTCMSGELEFCSFLAKVRETTIEAYSHEEAPFEKILERVRVERDASRHPLFQVTFGFREIVQEVLSLPGLLAEPFGDPNNTSKFDLSAFVTNDRGQYLLVIEYSTDLYETATIDRLLERWSRLLEEVIRHPDRKLSEIDILPPSERQLILTNCNNTASDCLPNSPIHRLIQDQARQHPDAPAVICNGEQLSYFDLNRRANLLASYLRRCGVKPGTIVALYLERGVGAIVALLGILKVGAAYVPLDPGYPSDRLTRILNDTAATLLLTEHRLKKRLPKYTGTIITDDEVDSRVESIDDPTVPISPESAAYLISTSGSEGQPKQVVVTHGGLLNSTLARLKIYKMEFRSFLLTSSFAFDSSVAGIFWTLTLGKTLYVAPQDSYKDPAELISILRTHQISHTLLVPAMHSAVLDGISTNELPGLNCVIVAGDNCDAWLVEKHYDKLPETKLFNEYGPTEATVWATVQELSNQHFRTVPIGRPIANVQVYVLDANMQPAPIGVAGELFIGGAGVARGYLNCPGLTAETFLPDPFTHGGSRLYRTGDFGLWRADGTLEFLGRSDGQVKLRGFRIELQEIEAVLRKQNGIHDAAVLLREDTPGAKCLVAYIVADHPAITDHLRVQLRSQLPEHMVPTIFLRVERLPLNANGKVDRKKLPPPEAFSRVHEDSTNRPRNDLERRIAAVWCEVLKVEKVGREDNFFDLGGHSLLVASLRDSLQAALSCKVAITDIFTYPTISLLAAYFSRGVAMPASNSSDRALRQKQLSNMQRQRHQVPTAL